MTIKNGDLPAMPLANGADGCPWTVNDLGNPALVIGLTKREQFAAMAMQGLLSHNANWRPIAVAETAAAMADALLAELEKSK